MNPKSAPHLSTVPDVVHTFPEKKVKSCEVANMIQKSLKQIEQTELYYALQMTKENTAKLEEILAKQK
jgi:hypothetical protein